MAILAKRSEGMISKVFIIAEAGVNHNGPSSTAKKMIDVAAQSGGRCC